MTIDYFDPEKCPECGGLGWLLGGHHRGQNEPPLTLDLCPCYYPSCGTQGPPLASLGVRGQFNHVVFHPSDGTVMALTGYTGPAWR